ncbi:hypothetical protein [Lysobacter sp. 1R34A]|uniref:hypothetical protein n=1 Tax=Lysobacter sp. 1R34A TaxID=3445786 RepID=UPI003EEC3D7B
MTTAAAIGGVALGNDTEASATGAVAIGGDGTAVGARARASNALAIGGQSSVAAAGTSGIALGRGATVNGAFGIAQGDGVVSGATGRNVAIGSTGTTANSSSAIGGAVAIGRAQTANGNGAVAIGDPNTATGTGAVAVGADNNANGQGAVALGNLNTATGQGAVALGNASSAGAAGAVAIGDGASANIARSVALGSGSATAAAVGTASTVIRGTTYNFAGAAPTSTVSVGTAGGERTVTNVAAGRLSGTSTDAVNGSQLFATNQAVQAAGAGFGLTAQGANGSNVDPSEAVDLRNTDGNIAVSKVAGDNNVAFDLADDITVNSVTAGATTLNNTGLTIAGGLSVTAAGINAGGQVISNVAPGVAATDGVNKSQLDAVGATANAGFNVSAQGANSTNVAPGETVDLNNTDGNIVVSKTGADDNVAFDLADDITVTSVTAGTTTLNSTGLTIAGGPSVTSAGIDAGGQVINNVAPGVAATDGVNKSQLDAVGATANAGFNVSAQGANSTNVAPGETVDLNNTDGNIVVSKTGADDNVAFDLADDITVNSVTAGATTLNNTGLTIAGGPSVTAAGINAGNQVITNVAPGVAATDGVNKSQLDAVGATANAGFNVSAQGANATNVAPGETVDLNNSDGNIVVSKTGADDNVAFDLADDITVNSVTAGTTTLNSSGLTIAGGPSVTAAGINAGGQVISNVAPGVAATDGVNKSQLDAVGATANAGFNVSAQGANATNVAPGETVDFNNSDGNIVVSKTGADDNVAFDLADDITVNSVTAGNSRLDNTGLVITGGPSVTASGIDAGGQVISNVAPGVAATDGVNKSQLDAVGATANAGFNVSAQGANSTNVAPGQTVDLNNTDGNIVVSKTGTDDNVSFDLADDITVNSVTAGNSRLDNTGLVITGGPSVTTAGINAGNQVISNVAAGVAGTDGVNVTQLNTAVSGATTQGLNFTGNDATAGDVHRDLGQTLSIRGDATTAGTYSGGNVRTVTDPATGAINVQLADSPKFGNVVINDGGSGRISGVTAGTAATDAVNKSQLDAVGATANAGFNVSAQGANSTNVAPGETVDLNNTDGNIVVSKTGADDNVSFDLVDDITVNSVTAGATTLNSSGLTIAGGPSVTSAGIDAGSRVISNVAPGVAATDGVNKSQLDAVAGGSTTLGLNFTGNDNTAGDVHRDLGQTLSIRGDATAAGTYSGGNVRTVTDPTTGAINVQLADSPKFGNVIVNDGGTGKINGVTAADLSAASTEAVNGSQLFQTNQDAAALGNRVTTNEGDIAALNNVVGPTDQAYQDANGHGVRYVRTNDTGLPESDAFATGANSTAVGYNAQASAEETLAIGENAVASALSGLALGSGSEATAEYAIAIGDEATASGRFSLAVGDTADASGESAIAIGLGTVASGSSATALGSSSRATENGASALGNGANASAVGATAIGLSSQASSADSVALGSNSIADGATLGEAAYVPDDSTYPVAGTFVLSEVSIGSAGNERRLTNVAAGAVDTDAANISQLKAVDSKITSLGQDSLLWDPTANGGTGAYNANHLGTGPNKIVNVAPAELSATSADAVNGSQLFQTNQDVAALDSRVTTNEGDIDNLDNRVTTNEGDITNLKNAVGPTDPVYLQQNGRGVRYARTNDTGLAEDDAHAQVAGSTAVGYNATSSAADAVAIGRNSQASHAGSVALGANAVANGATLGTAAYVPPASTYAVAGTAPIGEVSIGSAGSERRLTNVAAGAGDTDAANISQLKAVDSKITALGQDSLLWDPTANGGAGAYNANHGGTGPNKIVNVAPAELSATSADAVNGSQLFQTNQDVAALDTRVTTAEGDIDNLDNRVTTNEGDITNIKNQMGPTDPAYLQQNGRGMRYARTNDTGLAEDDAHAQGVGSTAVGYNATSSAADAVAIGRNSQASHAGSVALGAGSVADGSTLGNAAYLVGGAATGEVNVGNRRVTGVAAGAQDTDAVNVSQLKAVANSATQAEQRSVKYDWNDLDADGEIDPGEVDFSKATLAGPTSTDGGATGGSKITNLAQGEVSATSTDAVNGAQLYNVAGPNDATYISQNGRGTRYARTNDTGLAEADAHAQAAGASAMGYNATASAGNAVAVGRDSVAGHANSVALGAGSSTTAGAQSGYNAAYVGSSNSTGQVQVGGRTIGGVAAGSAADDAVNVAQLQAGVSDAVTQANAYTDTRVDQIAGNVAQYDNRISAVEGDVNNVKNGSAGLFQVSQDNTTAPTASGANAAAGGAGAVASGTGSTALGNGAIASANNAVALGAGSVANQEGTVSVGSAGGERRVTNVAAGSADTDAVNVAQLKGFTNGGLQYDKNADGSNNTNSLTLNPNGTGQTTVHNVAAGKAPTDAVNVSQLDQAVVTANSYTDGQIATVRDDVWKLGGDVRRLERDMHSGIATAISMKPAPYVAGRTTYYAGFGGYKSEVAFGVSLRHTSDDGRWSLEGGASSNRDGIGAYLGVSGVLGD